MTRRAIVLSAIVVLSVVGAVPSSATAQTDTADRAAIGVQSGSNFTDVNASDLAGSGTDADPYVITNASELQAMEDDPDASYVLGNDIDASSTADWNDGKGFDPVTNNTDILPNDGFTGSLDGNGYTITGLTIDRPTSFNVGLFADGTGTVSNITLVDIDITGSNSVGAIMGYCEGSTVRNVSVNGVIYGEQNVGGFVGDHEDGLVQDSWSTATVNGTDNVGGAVGKSDGDVLNVSTSGLVVGQKRVGGLVGSNDGLLPDDGSVRGSTSTATVNGTNSVGGAIGESSGEVVDVSASGLVVGQERVGGLVGDQSGGYTGSSSVRGSTSTATVNGTNSVGGAIGTSNGEVVDVSASGLVVGQERVGGLVGSGFGRVRASTSTATVNGTNSVGGAIGYSVGDVVNVSASGLAAGQERVGGLVGSGRGRVRASTSTATVNGTNSVGGAIGYSVGDVVNVSASGPVVGQERVGGLVGYNGETFSDAGSVRGSSSTAMVSGTEAVGGAVGRSEGRTVNVSASGLVVGDDAIGGLVGSDSGRVRDSRSTATVNGTEDVGGAIGVSSERVVNVSAVGHVVGQERVGGLVGNNAGFVQDSWSTATVNGTDNVGGAVGRSEGRVVDVSASGPVVGQERVGGLVGYNDGNFDRDEARVRASSSTATVNGTAHVGGAIGESSGQVINVSASVHVDGNRNVGGLVGYLGDDYVSESSAGGSVEGNTNVGGLVGYADNPANIVNSTASGTVEGGTDVGGLVGSLENTVRNSSATATVTGTESVGGLVGNMTIVCNVCGSPYVENAYATGDVTGTEQVGGLVGTVNLSDEDDIDPRAINQTYATGRVTGDTDTGGLVGRLRAATVGSSYWDTQTTGQATSSGGTGLTTAQMTGGAALRNMTGFEFPGNWVVQPNDYPVLSLGTRASVLPTARNDTVRGVENTRLTINASTLLANDTNSDGETLFVAGVASQPANGSAVLSDGAIEYTPPIGFTGKERFSYTVENEFGGTDTATVTITVEPNGNAAPIARNDTFTTTENIPVSINESDVLANDSDPDGDTFIITRLRSRPTDGTLSCREDTCEYTPDEGFVGQDTFVYEIGDTAAGRDTATVTITVEPAENTPPIARNDSVTSTENTIRDIDIETLLANDTAGDPAGDTLTFEGVVTRPTNGSLSVDDGTLEYVPEVGFTGQASFSYEVEDKFGETDTATVTVTVEPNGNSDPIARNDSFTTTENTTLRIDAATLKANDSDPDDDTFIITRLRTRPTNGTLSCREDTCEYTPDDGFVGKDTFVYEIADTAAGRDTATVTITVVPANSTASGASNSATLSPPR